MYVITRQNKTELLTFDNDASACYDQILPVLAAMASRRVGMQLIPCQLFTRSLQGMKYFTKVGEGVGDHCYRHTPAFPIYGTGQGSCASPVAWILISVVLINTLRSLHTGMSFSLPDGWIVSSCPIDGIVDDTTIGTNTQGKHNSCLEEAQELAEDWECLLFLSGGTLAHNKCFFYHIDWTWWDGKATMTDPEGSDITLPRGDQDPYQSIDCKHHNEAHCTLGVRIAPNGLWTDKL